MDEGDSRAALRRSSGATSRWSVFIIVAESGLLDPAREGTVREALMAAQAALVRADLWATEVEPLLVVVDVTQPALALTVRDVGTRYGPFAGKPTLLLSPGVERDGDVLLHELTHVWLRARGVQPTSGDGRWRLTDGRIAHEEALVHEAVADFVAAALTGDPVLGERSTAPEFAQSLRTVIRCPGDLIGQPHHDALVVSGALWELAQSEPDAMGRVLDALTATAPRASENVYQFSNTLQQALEQSAPALARRWADLSDERGLLRCATPKTVVGQVTARIDDFVAAGTQRLNFLDDFLVSGTRSDLNPAPTNTLNTHPNIEGRLPLQAPIATPPAARTPSAPLLQVEGPLQFQAPIAHAATASVRLHSSRRSPPLQLHWRAEAATPGTILDSGITPLEGWPSQIAHVSLPQGSERLIFGFINRAAEDVTFNAVTVVHTSPREPQAPPAASPAAPSSAPWALTAGLILALALVWTAWRQLHRALTPTPAASAPRPPPASTSPTESPSPDSTHW